jgi:PAS domain S-box-containing protein
MIHNSDCPPPACPHRALLEDGKVHVFEHYEDSLDMWMKIHVTPLYNKKKDLVGSIHISRDITRQKRSEQAQRESEERYHHLSEATIEGVLLSENTTIVAVNQVLADMLGYSAKEMNGMNMLKFLAPHDHRRFIESLRNRMTGKDTFECIKKDTLTHLHKMEEQVERIKILTHKMMHITKYETKDYAGGQKIIDLDQASTEIRAPSTGAKNMEKYENEN